jgi:hypothetical protein
MDRDHTSNSHKSLSKGGLLPLHHGDEGVDVVRGKGEI